MKKRLIVCLTTFAIASTFADENSNAQYISSGNYLQNPYLSLTSAGGTQVISESQTANQNIADSLGAISRTILSLDERNKILGGNFCGLFK